jgi:hypothetical protein
VGSEDYARYIRNELESGLAPFLERGTPGSIDGIELLYDGVHFSKRGGRRIWLWLAPQLGVLP